MCVCAHVWTCMHTPTHKHLSPYPWDQICWLSSDLLYIFWFVSACFFFNSSSPKLKMGLIQDKSRNKVIKMFLYFDKGTRLTGEHHCWCQHPKSKINMVGLLLFQIRVTFFFVKEHFFFCKREEKFYLKFPGFRPREISSPLSAFTP